MQGTLVDAMHPESAEIALPQFDAVGLARRAALPAAIVVAGVATLILVQGKLGVIADAFDRALTRTGAGSRPARRSSSCPSWGTWP